ncbi:MAG: menaquinol-cytochrome C reductase [Chloroflexi bacterium]|nr:menaquinol-cytochrome C reductase [Chloroflexota bacterium]
MAEPTTPTEAQQPEEQRRRVAAVARRARAAVVDRANETVFTWPNLLVIEFISALLMLLALMIVSWLVNAPLEAHSNPDRTPNPSKAPWYFLNLQELLLHMNPALAGVIIPTVALLALAAIPYVDRDSSDTGKWIARPHAVPIIWFTAGYCAVLLTLMILFDEFIGLKPTLARLDHLIGGPGIFTNEIVAGWIFPLLFIFVPAVILVWLYKRIWNADMREILIGLFTAFVVIYVHLTIVGTVFRGPGMHLYWPWLMPPRTD